MEVRLNSAGSKIVNSDVSSSSVECNTHLPIIDLKTTQLMKTFFHSIYAALFQSTSACFVRTVFQANHHLSKIL
jgi:hypothetical protein